MGVEVDLSDEVQRGNFCHAAPYLINFEVWVEGVLVMGSAGSSRETWVKATPADLVQIENDPQFAESLKMAPL
ncbi:hypothetical protein [Kitasatospora sp. NPDC059327]|uniref:hypothetical protein n=1 Tax=Kitasatospora sp. NPDC059327 TaxID=3346803 RepID=UPI00368347D8